MAKKYLAFALCAIASGTFFALYQHNNDSSDIATTKPLQQATPPDATDSQITAVHKAAPSPVIKTAQIVEANIDTAITAIPPTDQRYFFIAQTPHENGQSTVFSPTPNASIKITDADDAKRLITEGGAEHFNLGEDDNVKITSSKQDANGNSFYKFKQTYKGLPVDGRELVVQADDQNSSAMLAGFFESNINLDTTPSVTGERALTIAFDDLNPRTKPTVIKQPELQVYVGSAEPTLVYRSVVKYSTETTGLHLQEVFIDANDGSMVNAMDLNHSALNRQVYTLNGQCINGPEQLPGQLVAREGSVAPYADQHAIDAYTNMGNTYHFYKQFFNRDSLDDKGNTLTATVHARMNMNGQCMGDNAMFMNEQGHLMFLDGNLWNNPAGALDLVGHEMTHGVTYKESNLKYENESGAINEALSDVFGATVEAWIDSGGSSSGNPAGGIQTNQNTTWTFAEKTASSDQRKRFFYDPQKDGQSYDSYADRGKCSLAQQCPDNGYVHTNSGIMNLAFYLLAEGGTHPRGKTNNQVRAIGIEKAIKIYYHAATNSFTSTTNFKTARELLAKSAETLYGNCSQEWMGVHESYDAVQVPGYWPSCNGEGGGGTKGGGGCASESLTQNLNQGSQLQQSLRAFRDDELQQSSAGKRLEELYYKHTDEITAMMKTDWVLRMLGLRLIFRATYAFNPKQIESDVIPLNDGYAKLAISFLERAQKNSSEDLKNDAAEVKGIIEQLRGLTAKALIETVRTL